MTFKPGDKATWIYTPRGGYGFSYPVDAEVIKVNPKTITIKVKRFLELKRKFALNQKP